MLICRFLSFSLFVCTILSPVSSYQLKCNDVELENEKVITENPTTVVQEEKTDRKECFEGNENAQALDDDRSVELDNSSAELNSKDESVSQIVDTFVQSIEGFWQETRRNLEEYRKRKLPPGQWWLKEVENDYRSMKENFFTGLSPNTPQQCLEILADYEVRYNDIMWAEIEKEINRIQSFGDSDDDEVNDVRDFSYDESMRSEPYHFNSESLDDAYAAMHTREITNVIGYDLQTAREEDEICKKPTYEEVMHSGKKKNLTPLHCGEGIPRNDKMANS